LKIKNQKLRVGLYQYSLVDDFHKNHYRVFSKLCKIRSGSLDLIVLPEMWLGGPSEVGARENWNQNYYQALSELQKWCAQKKCGAYFSQLEKSGQQYFNTAYLLDQYGRIKGRYRKMHLFSLGGERKIFSQGKTQRPWKIFNTLVGGVICYDIRFPEQLRQLALSKSEIILVCAQWPQVRSEHWQTLLKARAIENQCYVIATNRLGKKRSDAYQGDSMIIDPWGKITLHLKKKQYFGMKTIDLGLVQRVRQQYPFLSEYQKCGS